MPLIDKERAYVELKHKQYQNGISDKAKVFEEAAKIIQGIKQEPDIDRDRILKCCNQIDLCLNNCYNTGSTLQTCDYEFIAKQLGFIKEELSGDVCE